jgi:hypothetical protein
MLLIPALLIRQSVLGSTGFFIFQARISTADERRSVEQVGRAGEGRSKVSADISVHLRESPVRSLCSLCDPCIELVGVRIAASYPSRLSLLPSGLIGRASDTMLPYGMVQKAEIAAARIPER